MNILICNVGSTSLKYQLFRMPEELVLASGGVERVGAGEGRFYAKTHKTGALVDESAAFPTHREAIARMLRQLTDTVLPDLSALDCVGFKVVLASSGKKDHLDASRKLLDVDDALDGVTTGDDADSSKPSGELFQKALAKVDGHGAVVIGDSPWDVKAAKDLPAPTLCLRCGGFAEDTLTEAGAVAVFDDAADLLANLDSVGLD